MERVFLFGPLLDDALRLAVLGRAEAGEAGRLADHALQARGALAGLVAVPGVSVVGIVLDVSPSELARLDFYHVVTGLEPLTVRVGQGSARAYGLAAAGEPWDRMAWQARWAATVAATAGDVMRLHGDVPVDRVRARYRLMLVRGGSRVRAAAEPGLTAVRRKAVADDLHVVAQRQPYANFFAVEEHDLAFRQFDGKLSETVTRAVFLSGDAVTVLPYDPVRDRVLLVEQFRPGPMARGDAQPWLLETIAGRIDPGEAPEDAARREAVEEAGIALGALLPVANYYPSPGAKAEFLYSYVAVSDLPDGAAGVFGVPGEAEDIRGHLVSFDTLMNLVASGEVCNAPLILTAFWLQRERPRLRGEARS